MKVLVADDSKLIRQRLVERLQGLSGVELAEAGDTTDALLQVETFKPDLVVLDIRMPGGGGIKALSEIKAKSPDTTVIIITNYPYVQYRRKCLDAGADFFFDKSTEFEQVAEVVRLLNQTGKSAAVAHRMAAVQLVEAKEQLEKIEQRQRDMGLLTLLQKPAKAGGEDQAYGMWEKTFDAMPDLIAIFDDSQRIVRVNEAMAACLGVPAAELAGKNCFEYMHGTDGPVCGCPHELMLRDLKEHSAEIYCDNPGKWFDIRVSPILQDGRRIGAIHIARDVTERKRAEAVAQEREKELKASEKRYRQMFESMQSGVALHEIICDKSGVPCDYRFLEVNAAFEELTGLKAGQLIGRTVKEVLPGTEPCWIESYGMVALSGVPMRFENFHGMLNRHYSVSVYSPQKGQFVTIFSDVTEQKNAQEAVRRARDAAQEASRAKTQLLANMSHELRTPLNAIIGLTELMKDSALDEEQRDYVNTIGVSGETLLTLISDLFDFSVMESGEMTLRSEPLSIRDVVDKALVLFLPLAASKGVELADQIDEDVPGQITGDSKRLQQVLVSLLQNAFKFTKKGFVRLTVKNRTVPSGNNRIEFTVEDSGAGMNSITMSRIFEAFQQGDSSNTRQYGGVGMGLTLSKKLVELMGGTFQVKSREGEGSLFSFYILDQSVRSNRRESAAFCGQWKGRRICIWSDDPADMHTAECLLERCGAMLFYKESAEEIAESLVSEVPGDVVLCNLDLPNLAEKLVELRKLQPGVPWIACSRWMTPVDDEVKSCFSEFIDRPLERDQLGSALELFLDSEP